MKFDSIKSASTGGVAERFKATVLKIVVGLYPTVSSNLTPSVLHLIYK